MRRRFGGAPVATLGTLTPSGSPHVVPITFSVDGDTLYTLVDRKPKTTEQLARLDNIRGDSRVTVIAHHYDDDWSNLWWVRVDGTARVIGPGPDRDRALVTLQDKYPQYRSAAPKGAGIVVSITGWRSWSASGS